METSSRSGLSWLLVFVSFAHGLSGCSDETTTQKAPPACAVDPTPFEKVVAETTVDALDQSCVGSSPSVDCGLEICGKTRRILFDTPLHDVMMEAFDENDELITQTTSDDEGHYCLSLSGKHGFGGRIRASDPQRRAHDVYFGSNPLIASTNVFDIGLESEAVIAEMLPTYGLPAADPTKGIVDPIFVDCARASVAGLTVELDRPYQARAYINDKGAVDANTTQTAAGQISGALFVNVDPGPMVVDIRRATTNGSTGDLIAQCAGEARAGHWTAISCRPH